MTKKDKRLYRTRFGASFWVFIGLGLFVVGNVMYDFIAGDITTSRYIMLGVGLTIIFLSLGLNLIRISTLSNMVKRYLGG